MYWDDTQSYTNNNKFVIDQTGGTVREHIIKNLSPETKYYIKVSASNAGSGEGSSSSDLVVDTPALIDIDTVATISIKDSNSNGIYFDGNTANSSLATIQVTGVGSDDYELKGIFVHDTEPPQIDNDISINEAGVISITDQFGGGAYDVIIEGKGNYTGKKLYFIMFQSN